MRVRFKTHNMRSLITILATFLLCLIFVSCTKNGPLRETSSPTTMPTGGFSDAKDASSGSSGSGSGASQPGVITAGEWNDLAHWDFWNELLLRDTINTFPHSWGFNTNKRISVQLKDDHGYLLHDVILNLVINGNTITARTDNFGVAELFPGLFDEGSLTGNFSLTAAYQGHSFDLGTYDASQTTIIRSIPVTKMNKPILDISFVVDATGSMGDEIYYLKNELSDVINRAGSQLAGTQIRMSSVFYRDEGDEYLTRPFAFTTNSGSLVDFIKAQNANGGGDFPEAVDKGLEAAIEGLQWSDDAVNRLLFLILDAPPHDGQEQISRIHKIVVEAQKKGVRIIPVSASGIDRSTEFFLRFLAVSTNSTYIFITNDSGIGLPHLVPTVGEYTVEYLNNLMVRLITKYGTNK